MGPVEVFLVSLLESVEGRQNNSDEIETKFFLASRSLAHNFVEDTSNLVLTSSIPAPCKFVSTETPSQRNTEDLDFLSHFRKNGHVFNSPTLRIVRPLSEPDFCLVDDTQGFGFSLGDIFSPTGDDGEQIFDLLIY